MKRGRWRAGSGLSAQALFSSYVVIAILDDDGCQFRFIEGADGPYFPGGSVRGHAGIEDGRFQHFFQQGGIGFLLLYAPAECGGIAEAEDGRVVGVGVVAVLGVLRSPMPSVTMLSENSMLENKLRLLGFHAIEYGRVIAGDIFIILQDITLIVVVIVLERRKEGGGYVSGMMEQ